MDKINLLLTHAIRADISAFSGTQMQLSRQVCGSNQGLKHKVANYRGQALHPDELVLLQQVSGSRHVIQEMARLLGGVFVSLPEIDTNVNSESSNICIYLGELCKAMQDARVDGIISADKRLDLERKAQGMISSVLSWVYCANGGVYESRKN